MSCWPAYNGGERRDEEASFDDAMMNAGGKQGANLIKINTFLQLQAVKADNL